MRRGETVKALTPRRGLSVKARLGGSKTVPTERAECVVPPSTLHHRVPVPLPVVHTPPLRSLDADGWGLRSRRNGRSLVQWRPLRPGTHCLRALRRRTPLPMRVRCALPIRPLPGEAHGPLYCRQVKSIQEQIHPTETTKLFISCEVKSLSLSDSS